MPMFGTPIAASRREPARAVRLPEGVKLAIIEMVETGTDFISAAKSNGLQAQTMRRWLGRAECIRFLRQERARFRATVCAQNEAYLVAIRSGDNSMAAVRAIQVLEGLDEQGSLRRAGDTQPGISLRIVNVTSAPAAIEAAKVPLIQADEPKARFGRRHGPPIGIEIAR
jgi:hypothetical protein